MQVRPRVLMYGYVPLYGVEAQPIDNAKAEARGLVQQDIPDDIEFGVLNMCVMGDPVFDEYLSVEVDVVFPEAGDADGLPDPEDLFPQADGVSFLAITADPQE